MEVLTIIAEKGGVGRTTLCTNLAGAFAESGKEVLLVDMEGQASLSKTVLGYDAVNKLPIDATTAALFEDSLLPEPENIICHTPWDKVALMPSSPALANYSHPSPQHHQNLHTALRDFLYEISNFFELVIIDTPPGIKTILAYAALVASDYAVVPVELEAYGLQAIPETQRLVLDVQGEANPALKLLGLVVSKRSRSALQNANEKSLRNAFQSMVFDTVIRHTPSYAEANAKRLPITHYEKDLKGQPKQKKAEIERVEKASSEIRQLVSELEVRIENSKQPTSTGRKAA